MENRNLNELREMAYDCTRCGYCREKYSDDVPTKTPALRVCPIWEHNGGFEHHCSRGKLQIAQGILEGRLQYSNELVDVLYTDPDCRLCSWVCNAEPVLDPPKVWQAMRRDIVDAGLGPPKKLKAIDSNVEKHHNVFGGKQELRDRWADGLNLPKEGEILYFAGCYASYTQTEIARSTVAILKEAGADLACLAGQEWCCGVVQFHDGSMALAEDVARHNIEAIRASGARTVVTACAECYKSFKVDYSNIWGELGFEVVHVSEMILRLINEGKITFESSLPEKKVTYHDPCRLGRYCGVYDPPRYIIESIPGVELVEMLRHREYAWCCGGGAELVPLMNSELFVEIAAGRIEEAKETGVQSIITSCPRCAKTLRYAGEGIIVNDLSVVVAKAMGLKV